MGEDETQKLSKTEEKQSFIKDLRDEIENLKREKEEFRSLVERNEEIAARGLLGGKTSSAPVNDVKKEISPEEYALNALKGNLLK